MLLGSTSSRPLSLTRPFSFGGRMQDLGHRLLDLLWLLPAGIASYGLKFLSDITKSIQRLNENILLVIQRVDRHEELLDDHEERIREVEH